jgi:hypothetical protein
VVRRDAAVGQSQLCELDAAENGEIPKDVDRQIIGVNRQDAGWKRGQGKDERHTVLVRLPRRSRYEVGGQNLLEQPSILVYERGPELALYL